MNKDIAIEIQAILEKNKLDDLKRFIRKRQCLNKTNTFFIYLFHLVQSSGILITSFATGSNNTSLIWVGVTLNIFASLIHIYEKTNNSILKKLLNDIKMIKDGTYIDEQEQIEIETENKGPNLTETNINSTFNKTSDTNTNNNS
jgi:hypothetical protein